MSRVFIIGGTGFLGLNLARALKSHDHVVVMTGTRKLSKSMRGYMVYPIQLSDLEALWEAITDFQPDFVIHMVSKLKPGSTDAQYNIERDEVLLPTFRLIGLLSAARVPLVFISSGGTVYGPTDSYMVAEDDNCTPISLYGKSKLEVERCIQSINKELVSRYLIIRPSNPYGPLQPLDGGQGLISTIFAKIKSGQPLEIWGDGTAVRDYIYVEDFVSSVCDVLSWADWAGTINVGSGIGHTALEVVAAVEEAIGRSVPVVFQPARGVDVPRVVLNVNRLKSGGAFHDRPLVSGIRSYAHYLGIL